MPDEKELVNMTPEEIAAAAEAEVAKNEDASKVVEEEKKPIVEASQPNLEEIVAKLAEVMKPGMTDAQREEQIKKVEAESGFDRKQLGWMTSQLTRTSITSNLGFAQEVGKSRAEKTLGNYSEVLIGKVEEEMKKLPVEAQANPEAWIQMAYLVKGKLGDSVKPTVKKTIIAGAEDDGGTIKVKGLTTPGNGGGAGGKIPSGKKYDGCYHQCFQNQLLDEQAQRI